MITSFNINHSWHPVKEKVIFTTLEDYTFSSLSREITIPAGFTTDFASVPRIFWAILPPMGKHSPAALVHDYLYDYRIGTRKEADLIFLDLMLQYNVARWRASIMYLAVRLFARPWWNN